MGGWGSKGVRKRAGRLARCRCRQGLCGNPGDFSHLRQAAKEAGELAPPCPSESCRLVATAWKTCGNSSRWRREAVAADTSGRRVVEAADGSLFITLGERGDRHTAQDLSLHNGKTVRIMRDGSVFPANPFIDVVGARPEIWSLGHRNPQGAALDAAGNLWVVEHGARGGDEINAIERGRNYGWPVIAYGRHYSGGKIGEGFSKEGLEQPEFYWDPSIAPSGMTIYSGKLWPEWEGHIFVWCAEV